jgi:hypothetical protein
MRLPGVRFTLRRIMLALVGPAFVCGRFTLLGMGFPLHAQQPQVAAGPLRIEQQTSCIGTGDIIGGFHRIEISATIRDGKGVGEMRLDSTHTALDDFGDRVVSGHALTKVRIRLSLLDRVDPSGNGRRIYEIDLAGARPSGPRFLLVADEKHNLFKSVVKDGQQHTAVLLGPKDENLQVKVSK